MPVVIAAGSIRANRTLSSCIMRQQGKATLPHPLPPLPLFTLPLRSYLERLSFLQRSNNKSRRTCVQWLDSRDGLGDGSAGYAGLVTSAATKWKSYLMNVDPARARGENLRGVWEAVGWICILFCGLLAKINKCVSAWLNVNWWAYGELRTVFTSCERGREREKWVENLLHVREIQKQNLQHVTRIYSWFFLLSSQCRL